MILRYTIDIDTEEFTTTKFNKYGDAVEEIDHDEIRNSIHNSLDGYIPTEFSFSVKNHCNDLVGLGKCEIIKD